MKPALSVALLLIAFCGCTFSHPCGGFSSCSDCSSSSCYSSGSSCCGSRSSCCDSGSSCGSGSCCCNTKTCCKSTSCVRNVNCEVNTNNCPSKCCCSCPEVTTGPPPTTPTTCPTITPPPQPLLNASLHPSVVNNDNSNNNSITIPTNINIQNEIRSETHVSIPVSVDVNNVNNIDIRQAPETSAGSNCSDSGRLKENPCPNNTIVVTVTVPVPIYRTIPVYYIVTIPKQAPVPSGCCQIVQPCIPYTYGGCQTSGTHCSQGCSGAYMYKPVSVCDTSCYRRNSAIGSHCGHSGCFRGQVDCSMCSGNFYESYETFMMCSGCFVPMPWG